MAARSAEKVQEVIAQTNAQANVETLLENTNIRKNLETITEHAKNVHVDETKLQRDMIAFQGNVRKKLRDEFENRFPSISERWKMMKDTADERGVVMDDFWWKWNIAVAIIPAIIIVFVCESMKPEMEEYYENTARKQEHRLMVEQGGETRAESGIQKRVEEKLIAEWSKSKTKKKEETADGGDDDDTFNATALRRRLNEMEQYLRKLLEEQVLSVLGFPINAVDETEEHVTNNENEMADFRKSSNELGMERLQLTETDKDEHDSSSEGGIIPESAEAIANYQAADITNNIDKVMEDLRKDQTHNQVVEKSHGDQGPSDKIIQQRGSFWGALRKAFTMHDKADEKSSEDI